MHGAGDSILQPESPSTRSDISRGNRQQEAATDDHFYKEGDLANHTGTGETAFNIIIVCDVMLRHVKTLCKNVM